MIFAYALLNNRLDFRVLLKKIIFFSREALLRAFCFATLNWFQFFFRMTNKLVISFSRQELKIKFLPSIQKRTHPAAQISDVAKCCRFWNTSGARKFGVPQIQICFVLFVSIASPKSATFARPSFKRIFPSLISRWSIWRLWRKFKADITWLF